MSVRLVQIIVCLSLGVGCGEKSEECMTDGDCSDGQTGISWMLGLITNHVLQPCVLRGRCNQFCTKEPIQRAE